MGRCDLTADVARPRPNGSWDTLDDVRCQQGLCREFPKIGDPNIVPYVVGSLLQGPQNKVPLIFGDSHVCFKRLRDAFAVPPGSYDLPRRGLGFGN